MMSKINDEEEEELIKKLEEVQERLERAEE